MKLPTNDAFNLARAMRQLPPLDAVPCSAFIHTITRKNDPQALLYLINLLDEETTRQIAAIDVHAVPEITGKLIHASKLKLLPPIDWLIKGEIPQRGLVVLFGASGAGKSFVGLDYALRIAQTQNVVYVAGEGQSGYPQRVEAWVKHHKADYGNLYLYDDSVALGDHATLESFMDEIGHLPPSLVVIDTVARAMLGMDENSSRDMGLFVKACNDIMKRFNCAVMLVHHTGKGGDMERGSSALRGASDVMLKLSPENDIMLLECSKTKDAEPFPTRSLKLLPVEITIQGQNLKSPVVIEAEKVVRTQADKLTGSERKVLTLLNDDLYSEGMSWGEIVDITGLSKSTLSATMKSLHNLKFVTKNGNSYSITNEGEKVIDAGSVGSVGSASSVGSEG